MAKILCIDDEAALREDVVEELQDAGYETIEADDGKSGLEAIKTHNPDLVLCDITMPEMDGYQVLAELRENCPEFAGLPFVFLSALADASAVKQGKLSGADDYLTKPIDFELMLATVEARLRQVERMEKQKEQQFVKLYTKLTNEEPKDGTSAATSAQQNDLLDAGNVQARAPTSNATDRVWRQSDGDSAPRSSTTTDNESDDNKEDKAKLAKIVGNSSGTTITGRFQLIALESIKWELGKHWAKNEKLVYEISRETIQSMLSPDDILKCAENNEYYVCFATLDKSKAAEKAAKIAQKIRGTILEKFNISNVLRRNPDVHSINISLDEVEKSDDVMNIVKARLKATVEHADASEKVTKKEIIETARIQCRRVIGAAADMPLVVAGFDDSMSAGIASLISASSNPEEITAQIDMLVLGQAAELIYQGYLTNKTRMVVSVNYSTLQAKQSLEKYQSICNELTDNVRKPLVFKLIGIPKNTMPSKISDTIKYLRTYSAKQMVRIGEPDLGLIDLSESGVSLLALDYKDLAKSLENEDKRAEKLVQQAHDGNVKVFVDNVPDKESAQKMGSLGVDYVVLLGQPMSIDTFVEVGE